MQSFASTMRTISNAIMENSALDSIVRDPRFAKKLAVVTVTSDSLEVIYTSMRIMRTISERDASAVMFSQHYNNYLNLVLGMLPRMENSPSAQSEGLGVIRLALRNENLARLINPESLQYIG